MQPAALHLARGGGDSGDVTGAGAALTDDAVRTDTDVSAVAAAAAADVAAAAALEEEDELRCVLAAHPVIGGAVQVKRS
jgi:hypothetical protein